MRLPGWALVVLLPMSVMPAAADRGTQRPLQASGRQVEAEDGDVIVVNGDDRISVVRRRHARVRVVADEAKQFVLVLADWGTRRSADPDGGVNQVWRFTGVVGRWPLDSRWEGTTVVLSPDLPSGGPGPSLSIETPAGLVAFMGGPPGIAGPPDAAAVLRFTGMSGGGREGLSFDAAEREAMSANFMPSFSTMNFSNPGPTRPGAGANAGGYWVSGGVSGTGAAGARAVPPPGAIGRMPRVVNRIDPEWPPQAQAAGIRGVVILEVAVALDGSVSDARVLRSIPTLDEAALDVVRQWRFERAGPEGRPDPLRVTVTVEFPPRQP